MLRHKPRLTYSGLTIVMSKPSRFDNQHLLSGNGGVYFNNECLKPNGVNILQCDVRLFEDNSPLIDNTKCILLLGEEAAQSWLRNKDNSLNEIRGSPYVN